MKDDLRFEEYSSFLVDGELKTPYDILKWLQRPLLDLLKEYNSFGYEDNDERYVKIDEMLSRRLYEEKRKACGRGALKCWRYLNGIDKSEAIVSRSDVKSLYDAFRSVAIRQTKS